MKTEHKKILYQTVARYGAEAQIDMVIEEMSELTKALLKARRLKYGKHPESTHELRRAAVAEELADVEIMLFQLKNIFSFDRAFIDSIIAEKVDRQRGRLIDFQKSKLHP